MAGYSSVYLGLSLGVISALRIFGLMVIVPILGLYASEYQTNAIGIGWAIGIYGLMQAFCQIPLGWYSDKIGRKPVIIVALSVFALASFLQALTHSIYTLIILRAIQGAAAINGVVSACAIDLAPKKNRTLVLGLVGMMIGVAFFFAMILGPILNHAIGLFNIYDLIGVLVLLAIVWVVFVLPPVKPVAQAWSWEPFKAKSFFMAASAGGVIHGVFTVTFSILPIFLLKFYSESVMVYRIYAPSMLFAMVIALMVMRRIGKEAPIKWITISMLAMVVGACILPLLTTLGLLLFISGFSVLEATLPVFLIESQTTTQRGSLMGGYFSSVQFGVFVVSLVAGYVRAYLGLYAVIVTNIMIMLVWLLFWGLYLHTKKCNHKRINN